MINQTAKFVELLTGDANTSMQWQVFCDYDKKRKDLARTYPGTFNDVQQHLRVSNNTGSGIYACINGGGRKQNEITQFRALFIDSDGEPYPHHWPITPHMIVERSKTHWHAYWFIDGNCDLEQWSIAQYSLAKFYGTDDKLVNGDRVMRVPGFKHCKDINNVQDFNLRWYSEHPKYLLSDVLLGHELSESQEREVKTWIDKRQAKLQTSGDYVETQTNINRYVEYLVNRAPLAIEGAGGDHTTFSVCAAGRDHGLSPETTNQLLLNHWNVRCDPPWSEEELRNKINNAYQYASNGLGSSTPEAMFPVAPPLPKGVLSEPPPKPTAVPQISPASDTLQAGTYGKNHTVNADTFLNSLGEGTRVIYADEQDYMYNGVCYDRLSKNVLESKVQRQMDYIFPKIADVNGTAQMIRLKTIQDGITLPCWLTDTSASVGNVIAFNNGLYDVLDGTLSPHTPDFFSTGVLTYDYDPGRQCPEWLNFLESIWPGDTAMKRQLQQLIGYLLVADYRHQRMAVFIGKGRSGKGTIARVLKKLLGDYNMCSPSLSGLAKDDILHSMSGKNVAIISDAHSVNNNDRAKVLENIKRLTGYDAITYSRKYLGAQTETFPTRLVMICNELPALIDNSNALAMRLLIFPFTRSFSGREDIMLDQKLEKELAGICNWAIEGLRDLYETGAFSVAETANSRHMEIMRELSPILHFVDERIDRTPGAEERMSDLYAAYQTWCHEFGMNAMRRVQFQKALQSNLDGELYRDENLEWKLTNVSIRNVEVKLPEGARPV